MKGRMESSLKAAELLQPEGHDSKRFFGGIQNAGRFGQDFRELGDTADTSRPRIDHVRSRRAESFRLVGWAGFQPVDQSSRAVLRDAPVVAMDGRGGTVGVGRRGDGDDRAVYANRGLLHSLCDAHRDLRVPLEVWFFHKLWRF